MKIPLLGKVKLPYSPANVAANLEVERDAGVTAAHDRVRNAVEDRAHARQRADEARAEVDRLRRDVGDGRAQASELEQALTRERSALLVLPQYDNRIADAERELPNATARAKAAVLKEARKRRDRLQDIADELAPVLEELRACERALDAACRAAGDPQGVQPALQWPQSLEDEMRAFNNTVSASLSNGVAAMARGR